jgi:hypothetical protein
MYSHAHAHVHAIGPGLRGKRALPRERGGNRVGRPRESDEEGVTLGVDLVTVVRVERRTKHALMLGEYVGVATAQPRQQSRRTLDVGEQKGDGPARKLRHNAQVRPITATCQGRPAILALAAKTSTGLRVNHGHALLLPFDEGSGRGAPLRPVADHRDGRMRAADGTPRGARCPLLL